MNIDEMTIGEARKIAALFSASGSTSHSFQIGESYLIRTVTMFQTGRVTAVTDSDVALEDAAWIADTGRLGEALKTGRFNEIEPFPDGCFVSRAAIVDFAKWRHELPRETK